MHKVQTSKEEYLSSESQNLVTVITVLEEKLDLWLIVLPCGQYQQGWLRRICR